VAVSGVASGFHLTSAFAGLIIRRPEGTMKALIPSLTFGRPRMPTGGAMKSKFMPFAVCCLLFAPAFAQHWDIEQVDSAG
jgi:hypothetical protein